MSYSDHITYAENELRRRRIRADNDADGGIVLVGEETARRGEHRPGLSNTNGER